MSWPKILVHYSCPQIKKNWLTNVCGTNKVRSCITSSNNIHDQIAIYIFLNSQEIKCCTLILASNLLMLILFPLTWHLHYRTTFCGKQHITPFMLRINNYVEARGYDWKCLCGHVRNEHEVQLGCRQAKK